VDDPELPAGECRVEGTLDQARDAAARVDKRKAYEERRLAEPIAVVAEEEEEEKEAEGGQAPPSKKAKVDDIVVL